MISGEIDIRGRWVTGWSSVYSGGTTAWPGLRISHPACPLTHPSGEQAEAESKADAGPARIDTGESFLRIDGAQRHRATRQRGPSRGRSKPATIV
jgi:hypothetical protein